MLTECVPAVFPVHQQDHTVIFCLSVSLLPLLWHSTSPSPSGGQQHHSRLEQGKPAETLHNNAMLTVPIRTSTDTHKNAEMKARWSCPGQQFGRQSQSPQRLVQTFRFYAGKIQLQICTYIKNTCIKNTNKIQSFLSLAVLRCSHITCQQWTELSWITTIG